MLQYFEGRKWIPGMKGERGLSLRVLSKFDLFATRAETKARPWHLKDK